MKCSIIAMIASGILSLSALAADVSPGTSTYGSASATPPRTAPPAPTSASTASNSATSSQSATSQSAASSSGKAAGIDTALAASAGGITATVLAVGAAAVVIGVALSDSGGGDDPAPPVTVQAE